MTEVVHTQFDELPYRRFTLPWYDASGQLMTPASEGWVALNETDKVSMVLRQGEQDRAVKLHITDAAKREVEWRPDATKEAAVASPDGGFDFRVRVTVGTGPGAQSYSCPRPTDSPWKLVIKKSTADTDVADPA